MLLDFGVVLAFIAVAAGFMIAPLLLQRLFAPRKPSAEKLTSYECGEEVIGSPWIKFNIRFYVFALVFLVFDVELIFILPWAVEYRNAVHRAGTQTEIHRTVTEVPVPGPGGTVLQVPGPDESAETQLRRAMVPEAGGAVADAAPIQRRFNPTESWLYEWLPWIDGVVFIAILVVGLVYVWAKGDLEWAKPRQAFSPAREPASATAAPPENPPHAASA